MEAPASDLKKRPCLIGATSDQRAEHQPRVDRVKSGEELTRLYYTTLDYTIIYYSTPTSRALTESSPERGSSISKTPVLPDAAAPVNTARVWSKPPVFDGNAPVFN